jgi:hypothetical protein
MAYPSYIGGFLIGYSPIGIGPTETPLFNYREELQQLLGDENELKYNIADLTRYINRARRKIAGATQCIRILPPSSGGIFSVTPVTVGSGYVSPVVTISGTDAIGNGVPNIPAVVTANVVGGQITSYTVVVPGIGYVQQPTATITDSGGGSGATATVSISACNITTPGIETYDFQTISALINAYYPGVESIIAVQSVALSWGSWKPMMRNMPWSLFQAYCRAWNVGPENFPTIWSQYAQGDQGSIYVYPIPSIVAQMDWDCYCRPVDLVDDTSVEAIPHPYTEAVPYYAAYLVYLSERNAEMAELLWQNYKRQILEARSFATPAIVPDFYGNEGY